MAVRLVVGLGNPGRAYARTRHNIGFVVVETLARRCGASLQGHDSRLASAHVQLAGRPVLLLEPLLFMNLSGAVLSELDVAFAVTDLLVVHDDLDLACGTVRVKQGGGSGGHRGVASLVAHLGPEFIRVRVGVGRPAPGEDSAAYVLAPFAAAEEAVMSAAVERAADAVEAVVANGVAVAMNLYNVRSGGRGPAAVMGRD